MRLVAGRRGEGPEEVVRRAFEQSEEGPEVVGRSFEAEGRPRVAVGRRESAWVLAARTGSGLPERRRGWEQLDEEAACWEREMVQSQVPGRSGSREQQRTQQVGAGREKHHAGQGVLKAWAG